MHGESLPCVQRLGLHCAAAALGNREMLSKQSSLLDAKPAGASNSRCEKLSLCAVRRNPKRQLERGRLFPDLTVHGLETTVLNQQNLFGMSTNDRSTV